MLDKLLRYLINKWSYIINITLLKNIINLRKKEILDELKELEIIEQLIERDMNEKREMEIEVEILKKIALEKEIRSMVIEKVDDRCCEALFVCNCIDNVL